MTMRLLFLFMMLSLGVDAQRYLVIQRSTSPRQVKYVEGDRLGFRLSDDELELKGAISAIHDDGISVDGQFVALERIVMVLDYDRVRPLKTMAYSALAAVPFFIGVTAANNYFNTGDRPVVDGHTYTMAGIFGGIGILFFSVGPKKYRLQSRWKLRTLDTRFQ